MEHVKLLDQSIEDSRFRIDRRVNMLGQDLTNRGFAGVKVKMTLTVEAQEPNGSGTVIKSFNSEYKAYAEGFGPADIGGVGTLQTDGNNCIVKNDPNAPTHQPAPTGPTMTVHNPAPAAPSFPAPPSQNTPRSNDGGRRSAWLGSGQNSDD